MLFRLNISRAEALRYYQGEARAVRVRADTGQMIQFPASHIRPYVTQHGIQGRFRIRFDDQYKLVELQKIAD